MYRSFLRVVHSILLRCLAQDEKCVKPFIASFVVVIYHIGLQLVFQVCYIPWDVYQVHPGIPSCFILVFALA